MKGNIHVVLIVENEEQHGTDPLHDHHGPFYKQRIENTDHLVLVLFRFRNGMTNQGVELHQSTLVDEKDHHVQLQTPTSSPLLLILQLAVFDVHRLPANRYNKNYIITIL